MVVREERKRQPQVKYLRFLRVGEERQKKKR